MAKAVKQLQRLEDLTPDAANVNKGSERGAYMLDWSLSNLGAGRSILADADGHVIAGNKTLEAAVERGLPIDVVQSDGSRLVVVQRTDLRLQGKGKQRERARLLAVADNRSSEVGYVPDVEVLLSHYQSGVDITPMYREDEIKELLDSLTPAIEPGGGGDELDATPVEGPTRCQVGDLWVIGGKHRLLCGDSTKWEEVRRLMGDAVTTAVLTDPPYGQNQAGVTNDEPERLPYLIAAMISALRMTDGILCAFSSPRTFPELLDCARSDGFHFERMLWLYKAAQNAYPWRGWLLTSEAILVFSKGEPQWNDAHPYAHDCYYKSEVSGQIPDEMGWHGSIKPLDVVQDLIRRVSVEGAAVYDPFLGSGTTLIAAHRENRTCYGLEIEPKYCDVILKRAEAEGLSAEKADG